MAKPIDVIKYEGPNTVFVYKHPKEDFNRGSQLIVHETQEAVFFVNGEVLDRFGPGKYTLEADSIPVLHKLHDMLANGPSQFHSEVYFVNLTTQMGITWGTDSKIRMFDPGSGLHLELGAYGEFSLRVTDAAKVLMKIVGTELTLTQEQILGSVGYSSQNMVGKFKALVMASVKSVLPRVIRENGIDILEVDEKLGEISKAVSDEINKVLSVYGFVMPEFFITGIATPDDDPNFRRLREQFAERTLGVREEKIKKAAVEARNERLAAEAQGQAQLRRIQAQGEADAKAIAAAGDAAFIREQGLAEADVMRAKGFTYQQETAREVGVTLAGNESGGGSGAMGGMAATIVQAGVGIGAAVAVAKQTSSAVTGVVSEMGKPSELPTWACPNCGATNTGKFCPECGTAKPSLTPKASWTCPSCGAVNTGKFCSECGKKKEN